MAVKRDNFGEEIGNSKASLAMLRNQNLSYSDDIAGWSEVLKNKYIVKQKIFSTPNYEKIRENCDSRFVMSYIKSVYDGLPSSPQVDRNDLRSYEYCQAQNKYAVVARELSTVNRNIYSYERKEKNGSLSDYEAEKLKDARAKLPDLSKEVEEAEKAVKALFAEYMERARENYITAIKTICEKLTDCKTVNDCMTFRKWIESQDSTFFSVRDNKLSNAVHNCYENFGKGYFYPSFMAESDKKEFRYTLEDKAHAHFGIYKYDTERVHEEKVNGGNIALVIQQDRGTSFYYDYPPVRTWEKDKYFVLDNSSRKIVGINFENEKAAFAYALELEQLKATLEEKSPKKTTRRKEKFKPNNLTHIYRLGEDYLEGKDVVIRQKNDENGNPMYVLDNDNKPVLNDKKEQIPVLECPAFQDYLGFKSGEFGRWENQEERKENLNRAYCAFLDLANALGIEDSDISLGNKLSIAFGSRGSGSAVAHFEPLHNVINITKLRGAGALGHEWAHALDYYIAREAGYTSTFATREDRHLYQTLMSDVMKKITTSPTGGYTEFYKNAKELDGKYEKYSEGYWSSAEELFARAFHCYIEHKLEEKGERNDYLCGLASNSPKTYPSGEEAERIFAAMDTMIAALKEKGVLHERTEKSKPKALIESDYIIEEESEKEKKPRKPKDADKGSAEPTEGQQELPINIDEPEKENSPAPKAPEQKEEPVKETKQESPAEATDSDSKKEHPGKPVNWNTQEQKNEGFTSDLFSTLDEVEPEIPNSSNEKEESSAPEQAEEGAASPEDLAQLLNKMKQDLEETSETKRNIDNLIAEVQGVILADKLLPGDIIYFGEREMINAATMKPEILPAEFAKINSVSERSINFTTYDSADCKHETGRETIFTVEDRTWQTELASRKYKPVSVEALKGPTVKYLCEDIVYSKPEDYSETYDKMKAHATEIIRNDYQEAQMDALSKASVNSEMLFTAMKSFNETEHEVEIEKLTNTFVNNYISRDSSCVVEIPQDTPQNEIGKALKEAIKAKENCECSQIGYYRPAEEFDVIRYEAYSDLNAVIRSQDYETFLQLKAAMPETSAANTAKLMSQGCNATELHTKEEWEEKGCHVTSEFGYDIISVTPVTENNEVKIKCESISVYDVSQTDKQETSEENHSYYKQAEPRGLKFYRFQQNAIAEVAAENNVKYQPEFHYRDDLYHADILQDCVYEILEQTSSFAGNDFMTGPLEAECIIAKYLVCKATGLEQETGLNESKEILREIFNLNTITDFGLKYGEACEFAKIVDEASAAARQIVQTFERSIEKQEQTYEPLKYAVEDVVRSGRGRTEVLNERKIIIPVSGVKAAEMLAERLSPEDRVDVLREFIAKGKTEVVISVDNKTATLGNEKIHLTQKEWDLAEARCEKKQQERQKA